MEQGLQKQPQWFAYECPCTPGRLVLHHFDFVTFTMGSVNYGEEGDKEGAIIVPTEFAVFDLSCERCGKASRTGVRVEDIDWFLDRLTPYVTHDRQMIEKILWYWDDGTADDHQE